MTSSSGSWLREEGSIPPEPSRSPAPSPLPKPSLLSPLYHNSLHFGVISRKFVHNNLRSLHRGVYGPPPHTHTVGAVSRLASVWLAAPTLQSRALW